MMANRKLSELEQRAARLPRTSVEITRTLKTFDGDAAREDAYLRSLSDDELERFCQTEWRAQGITDFAGVDAALREFYEKFTDEQLTEIPNNPALLAEIAAIEARFIVHPA